MHSDTNEEEDNEAVETKRLDIGYVGKAMLFCALISLYKEQLYPKVSIVRQTLQDMRVTLFIELNFIELYRSDSILYKIITDSHGEQVILFRETPKNFPGFVDIDDPRNIYSHSMWYSLCQFITCSVSASAVPNNSTEFVLYGKTLSMGIFDGFRLASSRAAIRDTPKLATIIRENHCKIDNFKTQNIIKQVTNFFNESLSILHTSVSDHGSMPLVAQKALQCMMDDFLKEEFFSPAAYLANQNTEEHLNTASPVTPLSSTFNNLSAPASLPPSSFSQLPHPQHSAKMSSSVIPASTVLPTPQPPATNTKMSHQNPSRQLEPSTAKRSPLSVAFSVAHSSCTQSKEGTAAIPVKKQKQAEPSPQEKEDPLSVYGTGVISFARSLRSFLFPKLPLGYAVHFVQLAINKNMLICNRSFVLPISAFPHNQLMLSNMLSIDNVKKHFSAKLSSEEPSYRKEEKVALEEKHAESPNLMRLANQRYANEKADALSDITGMGVLSRRPQFSHSPNGIIRKRREPTSSNSGSCSTEGKYGKEKSSSSELEEDIDALNNIIFIHDTLLSQWRLKRKNAKNANSGIALIAAQKKANAINRLNKGNAVIGSSDSISSTVSGAPSIVVNGPPISGLLPAGESPAGYLMQSQICGAQGPSLAPSGAASPCLSTTSRASASPGVSGKIVEGKQFLGEPLKSTNGGFCADGEKKRISTESLKRLIRAIVKSFFLESNNQKAILLSRLKELIDNTLEILNYSNTLAVHEHGFQKFADMIRLWCSDIANVIQWENRVWYLFPSEVDVDLNYIGLNYSLNGDIVDICYQKSFSLASRGSKEELSTPLSMSQSNGGVYTTDMSHLSTSIWHGMYAYHQYLRSRFSLVEADNNDNDRKNQINIINTDSVGVSLNTGDIHMPHIPGVDPKNYLSGENAEKHLSDTLIMKGSQLKAKSAPNKNTLVSDKGGKQERVIVEKTEDYLSHKKLDKEDKDNPIVALKSSDRKQTALSRTQEDTDDYVIRGYNDDMLPFCNTHDAFNVNAMPISNNPAIVKIPNSMNNISSRTSAVTHHSINNDIHRSSHCRDSLHKQGLLHISTKNSTSTKLIPTECLHSTNNPMWVLDDGGNEGSSFSSEPLPLDSRCSGNGGAGTMSSALHPPTCSNDAVDARASIFPLQARPQSRASIINGGTNSSSSFPSLPLHTYSLNWDSTSSSSASLPSTTSISLCIGGTGSSSSSIPPLRRASQNNGTTASFIPHNEKAEVINQSAIIDSTQVLKSSESFIQPIIDPISSFNNAHVKDIMKSPVLSPLHTCDSETKTRRVDSIDQVSIIQDHLSKGDLEAPRKMTEPQDNLTVLSSIDKKAFEGYYKTEPHKQSQNKTILREMKELLNQYTPLDVYARIRLMHGKTRVNKSKKCLCSLWSNPEIPSEGDCTSFMPSLSNEGKSLSSSLEVSMRSQIDDPNNANDQCIICNWNFSDEIPENNVFEKERSHKRHRHQENEWPELFLDTPHTSPMSVLKYGSSNPGNEEEEGVGAAGKHQDVIGVLDEEEEGNKSDDDDSYFMEAVLSRCCVVPLVTSKDWIFFHH